MDAYSRFFSKKHKLRYGIICSCTTKFFVFNWKFPEQQSIPFLNVVCRHVVVCSHYIVGIICISSHNPCHLMKQIWKIWQHAEQFKRNSQLFFFRVMQVNMKVKATTKRELYFLCQKIGNSSLKTSFSWFKDAERKNI